MRAKPENIAKGKWWDRAWSLVEGCTPVSRGCAHCWSRAIHERFHPGVPWGKVRTREDRLDLPLRARKPSVWAVWNDLFHAKVESDFAQRALSVMALADKQDFVVLTKRPNAMHFICHDWLSHLKYTTQPTPNVLLGISAEGQATFDERIGPLMQLAAAGWRTIVSLEPLLAQIDVSYALPAFGYGTEHGCRTDGASGVIVGGESGPGARPMHPDWVRSVRDQCQSTSVPIFIKQLCDKRGRKIPYDQWPDDLRVREWPE